VQNCNIRFTSVARVFCLKMTLQKTWSPSIAAQISKTHVLWYNLTTHCGIYKPILQIIFVIFILRFFSTHFVSIQSEYLITKKHLIIYARY